MTVNSKRVVITGIGIITPIGFGVEDFWNKVLNGKTNFTKVSTFDTRNFKSKLCAYVPDFNIHEYITRCDPNRMDRFAHLGVTAGSLAIKDAALETTNAQPDSIGIFMGSGIGGMMYYEKQVENYFSIPSKVAHPNSIPRIMSNSVSGHMALEFKIGGPNVTISTACSSSAHSIGAAYQAIKSGEIELAFAGGAEAPILPVLFSAFDSMRVMSSNNQDPQSAYKPFDKNRDGFVISEGAAVLVLEELESAKNRKAKIYAEIIGYGASNGIHHMVIPDPHGEDIQRAMRNTLINANINSADIDYINAHGTGTKANDKVETLAIKKLFRIPPKVSATKSAVGHTIGASVAIGAATTALAIFNGVAPPTNNLISPDEDCDLDYIPLTSRKMEIRKALVNGFGFGNNNGCLALARFEK